MNVGELVMLTSSECAGDSNVQSVIHRQVNIQSPLPRPADLLARPAWQPCGSVYTWSACSTASPVQLGTFIKRRSIANDTLYDASTDSDPNRSESSLPVCEIALGRNVTLLLTDPGEVYGVGYNDAGQMGRPLPDPTKVCTSIPIPIPIPSGFVVKKLACGWEHCAVVTTTGALFMWGRGSSGQCGIGASPERVSPPQQVVIDPEETICGPLNLP